MYLCMYVRMYVRMYVYRQAGIQTYKSVECDRMFRFACLIASTYVIKCVSIVSLCTYTEI